MRLEDGAGLLAGNFRIDGLAVQVLGVLLNELAKGHHMHTEE
jgi:hypothetical protein